MTTSKEYMFACPHCRAPLIIRGDLVPKACAMCERVFTKEVTDAIIADYRKVMYPDAEHPNTGADDVAIGVVGGGQGEARIFRDGEVVHAKVWCPECEVDIEYPESKALPIPCPFCKRILAGYDKRDESDDDNSVAVQVEIATLKIVRDTDGNVVGAFVFDAEKLSTYDLRGIIAELQVINQLLTTTIISLEGMGNDASTKTA
jgi:hypothetical protein